MTRQVLINTVDGPKPVEGCVAILKVGERRHRFIIHDGTLSDERSGYRFGSVAELQGLHYASNPYRAKLTDRQAAQLVIDRMVARLGLDKVESALAKAPALDFPRPLAA